MDNQEYVLSLDIGTTTIKSFVYDQLGQIQGHSSKKVKKLLLLQFHTVRNLHFFFQKFNFELARKIIELFLVKTRENAAVWDFLAVDNFDFTRKIVKKIWGGKTSENVGVLSKLNFWTKI